MKGLPQKAVQMVGKLRNMNPAAIYLWAQSVYKAGFLEGLRQGEEEFDDALILTEDEARDRLGEEAFAKFMGGLE